MRFSDEQIRKIVALKDEIDAKIRHHQEKIESLQENLDILDVILKGSSFTKASSLVSSEDTNKVEAAPVNDPPTDNPPTDDTITPTPITVEGQTVANAFVTPEKISIVMDEKISEDTPPFRTFFLGRIIKEMVTKDTAEADTGKIQKESIMECLVKKDDNNIKEIIISNYRQNERVKEIINTLSWSLARMFENIKK